MTHAIRPKPGILDITPYSPGKAAVEGVSETVKLSANETPFGPSAAAVAAYAGAGAALHRYPDPSHGDLRAAIGAVHGLDPARIFCAAGSDDLIAKLAQAYAGPGDEVLHTEHGFAMYRIAALAGGATPVAVAEDARHADVDALLAACTTRTRLVFLANPNNPTGTMIPAEEVARLAAGLPAATLLVLDAAYAEYVDGDDGGAALVAARDDVVALRTFSKIYGLAGLRVGWCYAPGHVIDVLNRIRGPFSLATPQLETAAAAVRDQEHVARSREETVRLRGELAAALANIGVASDPSQANFLLARFADGEEAAAADAALKAEGLIVREVANYGLPACLRITVGDAGACARLVDALGRFKGRAA